MGPHPPWTWSAADMVWLCKVGRADREDFSIMLELILNDEQQREYPASCERLRLELRRALDEGWM